MKITMLLVRHPADRLSPIIVSLQQLLTASGATVDVIYPDEIDPDQVTLPPSDAVIIKAKSAKARTLARRFHDAGVHTINSYPATELCRDKIATNSVLTDAGVPVPPTYVEADARRFEPLLADGPLIVKPFQGSQGQGISIAVTPDDLANIDHGTDPVMAQAYFAPDGKDKKVYRIGDEVFCVERVWPPVSYADKLGQLVELDDHTRSIALACGDALGIDLYGVDIIDHHGTPWVVDLSSFPGFKGVPDAAQRLCDYVLDSVASSVRTG